MAGYKSVYNSEPYGENPRDYTLIVNNSPFKPYINIGSFINSVVRPTFNKAIWFGDNVAGVINTFYNCYNLNSPIVFGNNFNTYANLFVNCRNFNQPITIPAIATNCYRMMYNCRKFNSPAVLLGVHSNCSYYGAFENCVSLNSPITFNAKAGYPFNFNIGYMFKNCHLFNQPVTFPRSIDSAVGAFQNCYSFNQEIYMENVSNCAYMLENCDSFNSPIHIGSNNMSVVTTFLNLSNMLSEAYEFGSRVYLNINTTKFTSNAYVRIERMFFNCDNSKLKVVYCPDLKFVNNTTGSTLTGSTITWTTDADGSIYNSAYNIRCTTNFSKIYT